MSPSGGVTRNTLRRQISGALRDEVLAGRLPSGKEFTVKQIAEQYGVSATPVREALFDLASQGLLVSDEHRGFQVRAFSAGDYHSIVQARSVIVEGIFSGCHPITVRGDAMTSLRRRASEAARAARGGDLDVLVGYDLRFWRELSAFVGNPNISDFLATLRVQGWVFWCTGCGRARNGTACSGSTTRHSPKPSPPGTGRRCWRSCARTTHGNRNGRTGS